jgi:hypothetical protein
MGFTELTSQRCKMRRISPAAASSNNLALVQVAGPIVHTNLVFRVQLLVDNVLLLPLLLLLVLLLLLLLVPSLLLDWLLSPTELPSVG